MNTNLITRENVLKHLEKLGRSLKNSANPSNYPYEKRSWAKEFEPKLQACRSAYAAIRRGDEIASVLRSLLRAMNTGIEYNKVSLLLKASTSGFNEISNWQIKNGDLVFVESNMKVGIVK